MKDCTQISLSKLVNFYSKNGLKLTFSKSKKCDPPAIIGRSHVRVVISLSTLACLLGAACSGPV